MDRAGGYAVQGRGALLIKRVRARSPVTLVLSLFPRLMLVRGCSQIEGGALSSKTTWALLEVKTPLV